MYRTLDVPRVGDVVHITLPNMDLDTVCALSIFVVVSEKTFHQGRLTDAIMPNKHAANLFI